MNRCLTSFEAKLALEQLCDLTSIRKTNVNSSVFSLTSSIGVVGASGLDGGSSKDGGSGGGV